MTVDCDAELEQAKLNALKDLAYGASHEINNPLANISARAQALLRDETDPERRRALEAIDVQALRAHEMISDLMLFARPPELVLRAMDLTELLRQVVDQWSTDAARRQIEIKLSANEQPMEIDADAEQLGVAIGALIRNSIEAIGADGRVELAVEQPAGGSYVQIHVTDDGPGISSEIREHMFDPFYSGREAGRGLGFGLSKCWRIVTDHGGTIAVERSAGGGARFTIELGDDHGTG